MIAGTDLVILGVLLLVAYILGRLGHLVGLPAIPVYMAVGLLCSPHTTWFPLSLDPGHIELIAIIGLVLLLFSLGLEFDQDEFFGNAGKLLITGGFYIVLNIGVGFAFGMMVGWGPREALVIAGMVGTSSSAIITKLLIELRRLPNDETPMILGVTVVGDIFIAVYLAIVSVVLSGKTEVWPVVIQLVTAFFFLVAMFGLARFGGKVVSRLLRTRDEELFTILFFGLALLFGGIGEAIGVSDAIGAFLIGLVLGATTMSGRIERVAVPLRDVFAAFFFVNFGLGLNVAEFPSVIGVVLLAVAMTFVLNVISGLAIAKMYGFHLAEGINASAILVNRGEFTLILATLSVAAGLNDLLTPFAGLYVLIMAVLGPVFAANSERLGALLGTKKARSRTAVPNSMHAEEIALVDAVTDDDPERTQRAIDRMVEQAMSAEAPDGEEGDDH